MGSVLMGIGVRFVAWVVCKPVTLTDRVTEPVARIHGVEIDEKTPILKSTRMAREHLGERHMYQIPFRGDASGQPK